MIRSFADHRTESLFTTGTARGVPPDIARRAYQKLQLVDLAASVLDLRTPAGNRLHALKRDRKGQFAIAVNDQWRICFQISDGDAFDVELCDYH